MSNTPIKKKNGSRSGFTLLEMIVAMSLYSILVAVAVGGFVNALRTQRQVAAVMNANTTASLVLEQIAREVRTGRTFDSSVGVNQLSFKNIRGENVLYCVNNNHLMRAVGGVGCALGAPLTPDNIKVSEFWVAPAPGGWPFSSPIGWAAGDGYPPRVTIELSLSPATMTGAGGTVIIQTTVSARNIDS